MRVALTSGLDGLLASYDGASFTYPDAGATRQVPLPSGYAHTRRRDYLGVGDDVFSRASQSLLTWQMHRRFGLHVASYGPAEPGATVLFGMGIGLVLVIPCRVIYVIDEPTRRGLGYGTLPGHPEQGEEAFAVTHEPDDSVWLETTVFSRPSARLLRRATAMARFVQVAATVRYKNALAASVG